MGTTKYLLVASTEAFSGKSATILGVAAQLQSRGIDIGYAKPVAQEVSKGEPKEDSTSITAKDDLQLMAQALSLPEKRIGKPILTINLPRIDRWLRQEEQQDVRQLLSSHLPVDSELVLIEGLGNLTDGHLFSLSAPQIAAQIDAKILLVARYHDLQIIDVLLAAKQQLGEYLIGVMINDVPNVSIPVVTETLVPYLESVGIPVFGVLPRNSLLRSITVRELCHKLDADVLCRRDRLDLMVESLSIGAMGVNSALAYFSRGKNMAVVTGGDREDIQLAALETSTQCLILTGHLAPKPFILSRADDLEIPILSVDLDTLTTVEIIDQAFGQVRLQEAIKVDCVRQMIGANFNIDRLISTMEL